MGVIEDYWAGATQRLQVEADVFNRLVQHNGEMGRANEISVASFLEKLLPPNLGVGTGMLIDHSGSYSKQCDLVIYERHLHPQLLSQGTTLLHPVDTVALVVEVKTILTEADVVDLGGKAASIRKLELSTPGREAPLVALFSYHSSASPVTTINWLKAQQPATRPDLVSIVDPGIFARQLHSGDFEGQLVPLHAKDAAGERRLGVWQEAGAPGAFVERGGNVYPVTTLVAGHGGTRYLFEPGRALLLFCDAILEALGDRGVLTKSWWGAYLDSATRDTVKI